MVRLSNDVSKGHNLATKKLSLEHSKKILSSWVPFRDGSLLSFGKEQLCSVQFLHEIQFEKINCKSQSHL
uniref:Ovule protein n=1 Tax=Romanomermis culicivorax TaxID=13658 RepID=A0A915J1W8_ROMCU